MSRIALEEKKGFTLVEIMIVVAVVGLLAALAIPGLLRARLIANENAAKTNIRVVRDAVESYRTAQNPWAYPPDLPSLATANPAYLDTILANATGPPGKQGYMFTYNQLGVDQFTLTAAPVSPDVTGNNTFFVDENGVVRFDNANGEPIQ